MEGKEGRGGREESETHDQRNLQQTAQLLLLTPARLGVHQPSLVTQRAIAPHQHVARNRLPENFDLEDVGDDLLGLPVNVGVDERNVVVASNDVAEGGKPLLDSLDGDRGGKRIADVLELLVGARAGQEETVSVSCRGRHDGRGTAQRDGVSTVSPHDAGPQGTGSQFEREKLSRTHRRRVDR